MSIQPPNPVSTFIDHSYQAMDKCVQIGTGVFFITLGGLLGTQALFLWARPNSIAYGCWESTSRTDCSNQRTYQIITNTTLGFALTSYGSKKLQKEMGPSITKVVDLIKKITLPER